MKTFARGVSILTIAVITSLFLCSGASTPSFVAAGYFEDSTGSTFPCYWADGALERLSLPSTANSGSAQDATISGKSVYVAGVVYGDSGGEPAYWIDGKCVELSLPDQNKAGWTNGIAVYGESAYVTGWTTRSGYFPCYWKDGLRVDLPGTGCAIDLGIRGKSIVVVGYTEDENGSEIPGYWENGILKTLEVTKTYSHGSATGIAVSGNSVYISGSLYNGDESRIACYWLNGKLVTLPTFDKAGQGRANGILLYGGNVYVVGWALRANGSCAPCYWKNKQCLELSAPNAEYDGEASSFAIVGGQVCVAGGAIGESGLSPYYWVSGKRRALPLPEGAKGGWAGSCTLGK